MSGWFRRAATPSPHAPSDSLPAELTEAEEAALTLRYVSQSPQALREAALNAPTPDEDTADSEPDTDEELLEWEERDDVFRPQEVDAAALLASFALPGGAGFNTPLGNPGPNDNPGLHPLAVFVPSNRAVNDPSGGPAANRPADGNASTILVHRTAWSVLRQHLASDVSVEQGGLLLGQAFHDPQRNIYVLVVEQALAARDGVETAVSFSYTEATWQHLTPHLQQMGANRTLLGSYHSHPDMGVFLSQTDLDTQAEVFPHDWQIALVVDPVTNESGFFLGKAGEPCPRRYLVDG